jgi:ribose transport system substrate-binding protein
MRPQITKGTLAAVGAALLVAVAACSSSGKPNATAASPSSGSSSASQASGLAYAQAQITAHYPVPGFNPPGPAFDARKGMHGKSIFSIGIGTQDQFIQVIQNSERAIASAVGFKYTPWPNTGTPDQWARGIETAISEHASLIDLLGINPEQVAPQIADAKRAGIPVASTDAYDLSQTPAASLGLATSVRIPYAEAGRLMADWEAVATNGKANAMIIGSPEVVASAAQVDAIKSEFAKVCPACNVQEAGITIANWATQIQPQVQSAIRSAQAPTYILPIYDSASQFVIAGINASGAQGRVHISTYDGTPFVLQMLESGNTVTMDVGQDLDWLAYAFMDQEMRYLSGQKPVADENLPLRVFTKQNVNETGVPPKPSTGYGTADISGYHRLWGISG